MSGSAKIGLLGVLLVIVFVAVVWDRGNEASLGQRVRQEIVVPEAEMPPQGLSIRPDVAKPPPPIREEPEAPVAQASGDAGPGREDLETLAPPPAAPEVKEYVVQEGDNLWKIAKKVYGDGNLWSRLAEANEGRISDPGRLRPGDRILVPEGFAESRPTPKRRVYVARKGDTLYSIARATLGDGNKWKLILEANRDRVPDPTSLPAGTALVIPGDMTGGSRPE